MEKIAKLLPTKAYMTQHPSDVPHGRYFLKIILVNFKL